VSINFLFPLLSYPPFPPLHTHTGLLAHGLMKQRKLALILDLDNTLIHAHPVPHKPAHIPAGMFHVLLRQGQREDHHLVQRRHGLHAFLTAAAKLYQLSVYTHGLRKYAEGIVSNIDPDGSFFGHRVVSWYVTRRQRGA
jgi:TFIIF-interacting CTD phosphatase-like protein